MDLLNDNYSTAFQLTWLFASVNPCMLTVQYFLGHCLRGNLKALSGLFPR